MKTFNTNFINKKYCLLMFCMIFLILLSGCSTTSSIPYKASTSNIISIQQAFERDGKVVSLGKITSSPQVQESPVCRLMGPIDVAPGESIAEYIEEAFKEELFLARVYSPNAQTIINGNINSLTFSSVSPANWKISMSVSSNNSAGYTVSINYVFDTSFDAYSACKNVADAFGPAIQDLLEQVVTHPEFASLAK